MNCLTMTPFGRKGLGAAALCVALAALVSRTAAEDAGATLAVDGKPLLPIVVGDDATEAELTAVSELASHLARIVGAEFPVVAHEALHPKTEPAIYLGHTDFALANGCGPSGLGDEESLIRTAAGSLILTGGRPRGTLYAVYRFLEDDLGCRWYTPWADRIPERRTLSVPALDRRVRPAFVMRDTYTQLPNRKWSETEKEAWFAYCARNRLNGPSIWVYSNAVERKASYIYAPGPDWGKYGGAEGLKIGGPHTFRWHFPPEEYFAEHPDWYSMRKGQRVPSSGVDGNHLCITNPGLRRAYAAKLKTLMRDNPEVQLYSVAMNDGGNPTPCDCPDCLAAAATSSWSDVYMDFLNALADGVREEFPRNKLWTIAYSFASDPPKTVRARDNVQVMCCLLSSRKVHTYPESYGNLEKLAAWARMCGNVQVWDYVRWYSPFYSLFPSQYRSAAQLRSCRDLGVVGVMAENEVWADRKTLVEHFPMRNWIYAKLMDDPDRAPFALLEDYALGVYGPAGAKLMPYFRLQRERLNAWPNHMLDLDAYRELQSSYDAAETAAAPPYLARIRTARIWADMTGLLFRNKLAAEFVRTGDTPENYPFPARALLARLEARLGDTDDPFWRVQYNVPHPSGPLMPLTDMTLAYVRSLARGSDYAPLPERFRDIPADRIIDIPGYQLGGVREAEVVEDSDSVFGVVSARRTADELPVLMGVYDHTTKASAMTSYGDGNQITANRIAGPGYHLYHVGRTTISTSCVFYFTKSWQISYWVDKFHEPQDMGREWDIYVSVKLDGPGYPHGSPQARDGVYIERLILVRAAE